MQLDVSADQAQVLAELLEKALGDVREEIYKAEVADFKALLKQREQVIVELLTRLRALSPVT
jgi:hypothetical protein